MGWLAWTYCALELGSCAQATANGSVRIVTISSGDLDSTRYPTPAPSVPAMLRERVTRTPDLEAFRVPSSDDASLIFS